MGCGPQHREFRKKKFYRQCRLGCRPQHREFQKRNSTGNASWGRLRNNFLYHTMSHSLSKILK
ncbi:hypothetical protein D1G04_06370 [Staphylococcus aureus]|nr:hypothetical protein D1G04_06370 [Staphylococcus aureus]